MLQEHKGEKMALTKTFDLIDNFGETINFPNCYVRVESVESNHINACAKVIIKNNINNVILETKIYFFTPDMNGSNFICQAYLHLKTLPEFLNATDC